MSGLLLGAIAGLVFGLTGAGGSVLAVPLLVFGLGWTVAQAVPVALLAVSAAALFGTVATWDVRHVRYRAAVLMASVGMLTAPLGLVAADEIPPHLTAGLFATVLVVVAVRMLLSRPDDKAPLVRICQLDPGGRFVWTPRCAALLAGTGTASGFLSGLLGVGGGFIVVPALRATSPLSMHSAIATSVMAIALTSGGTVAVSIAMGRPYPWAEAAPFVAGAMAGMLSGRLLGPRVAGATLQRALAVSMLAVAILMVVREF